MRCPAALRHAMDVVLDTNVFIYLFEDHAEHGASAEHVVKLVTSGVFSAAITPVTVAELLTKPLSESRPDIAGRYRAALHSLTNTTLTVLGPEEGRMAAALRAKYRLPLPDMLQVATCLRSRTPILITNDLSLARVSEITVCPLDAFR